VFQAIDEIVSGRYRTGVKAHGEGRLKEVKGKAGVTAEQMEISRPSATFDCMRPRWIQAPC
jgi:hypothetical protein